MHEGWWKLLSYIYATYAQHSALKSVYRKSQSVIGGKLFYSYRTVFELAQGYSRFQSKWLELLVEGSLPIRQTQPLKNPSKFWILAQMERTQSLQFWSILGPNLPLENQNMLKIKISAKTASLRISNNESLRSQKNHRILVKLSKQTFFGHKLGLNCHLGIYHPLGSSIYGLNAKFHLLGICCFQLYLEETTRLF